MWVADGWWGVYTVMWLFALLGDPLTGVSVVLSKDLPFPLRPSANST